MGLALGRGLALRTPHQEGKGGGAGLSGRGGSGGPSCSEASALVACVCVCGPCHGLGIPARSALHGLAFCDRLWEGLGYFGASRM